MKLKLIEYNVLNGFCNEKRPFDVDRKRLDLAVKVLEKEQPDILVLTEGYIWPFAKKDSFNNYKKLFDNLYNIYAPANNQFRRAPIVLSRFPIKFDDFSEYHKSFLRTILSVGGKKIFLDVVHPHPELSEQDKSIFLEKVLRDNKKPYILACDLNTISSQDNYDVTKLIKGYKRFMKEKAELAVSDMMTYKTVNSILGFGLIDTYSSRNKNFDYTVPTDLRSKLKDSAVRIDYIFCSNNFKILDAGIIKNKLTEMASDHYPTYAVLEV